jgi:prepilin-type N-terminal cleavage/methylation domain-containing protein
MVKNKSKKYYNFTLIELLITISIIGILVSLLLPSIHNARESTQRAVCGSNLSQLSKATYMYLGDYDDNLVSPDTRNRDGYAPAWILASKWKFDKNVELSPLWSYVENKTVFRCLNETRDTRLGNGDYKRSFAMNHSLLNYNKLGMINKTSSTLHLLEEEDPRGTNIGTFMVGNKTRWIDWPANNHGNKRIPLNFIDGHVESYSFMDSNTSQISWFWSNTGYSDRIKFIQMADPNQ